jgi:outer membrane receptor for ferrienterochelin and colicins
MNPLLIFLVLSGLHFVVNAAESSTTVAFDDTQLEELMWLQQENIEVVSKKTENKSAAAGIVSVINSEDIARYGGNNLFEILNRVTSIYMTGSPLWNRGNASVRGDLFTDINSHTLVLINGRPYRDNLYGGVNETIYRDFPIHQIEQIEVMRGSGSVLYGSNAFTGVINIVTKKAKDNSLSLRGHYGSFNTGQIESEFSWKNPEIAVSGAVRYRSSNGVLFSSADKKNRLSQFRDGDKNDVSANLLAQWQDLTLNAFFASNRNTHWGISLATDGTPQYDQRLFVDLGYKKQINSYWLSQWNFTYNQNTAEYYSPIAIGNTQSNLSENNLLFEQTQFLNFFDNKLNFLIGGLVEWQTGRINKVGVGASIPTYDHLQSSIYAEMSYSLLRDLPWVYQLKLSLGGKWNHFEHLEKSPNDQLDQALEGKIGRLGLVYELNSNLGMKLLYNQAFHSPPALSLEANGFLQGDRNLKSERIETLEAQWFYHAKNYQISLAAFRSRLSSLIAIIPSPPNHVKQANFGSAILEGLELETQAYLSENLQWKGAYTFQANHNASTNQNNVSLAPNHIAKIGLSYDVIPGLQLSLFDSFASKAKVLASEVKVNPMPKSYHNISLNANFQLNQLLNFSRQQPVTFTFYINNLLNQAIYYPDFNLRQVNSISSTSARSLFGELAITF